MILNHQKHAGRSTRLALAIVALCAGLFVPAAAQEAKPFALPPDAPLFKLNGRTWTAAEFEAIIRFSPPGPLQRIGAFKTELANFTEEQVIAAIREFAISEVGGPKGRAAGTQLPEPLEERLARERDNQALMIWYDRNGVLADFSVSEEELKSAYEEKKDSAYKVDEQLELRHIYLSTYEDYAVKEGDTLESIAEQITGSAEKAGAILARETAKPRADKLKGKDGEDIDPQPLQVGEILMVPMSEEKAEAVRQRAGEVAARLAAGEDFEAVAREMSQADNPAKTLLVRPARDQKPILQEVHDAFMALEDNGVSPPFRTRHGWQIVQRLRYTPEGYRPLDDVRERLQQEIVSTKRQKTYEERVAALWAAEKDLEIDDSALAVAFDESHANHVIFQIEDVKYLCSNFRRDFIKDPGEQSTIAERRTALRRLPLVQQYLVRKDIAAAGIKESEPYPSRLRHIEDRYLSFRYVEDLANAYQYAPTDEEIARRYEELADSTYTRVLGGDVWVLSRRVDPDGVAGKEGQPSFAQMMQAAMAELKDLTAGCDSPEKFEELARKHSTDEFAERGGKVGRVNVYTDAGRFGQVLRESTPHTLSKVYEGERDAVVYWTGDRTSDGRATLEDARPSVIQIIQREKRNEFRTEKRKAFEAEGGLVLLFGPEA